MLEDLCLNKPIEHLYKTESEKVTMNNDINLKLQKEPKYEICTSAIVACKLSL